MIRNVLIPLLFGVVTHAVFASEQDSVASVPPSLTKVIDTKYQWVRNFKIYDSKEAAIQAACRFVINHYSDAKCPLNVDIGEGKLGYGLYVSFKKKNADWQAYREHTEKFNLTHSYTTECKDPSYLHGIDYDEDGDVDQCFSTCQSNSCSVTIAAAQ